MTVENLETRRITLDSGLVIYEIYDEDEGVYEYYLSTDEGLDYIIGVGEPFMPESLQMLYDRGFFEN
jgi:hypothetical protein